MLTKTETGRHLINESAYYLVVECAPQEAPIFVELRDKYLKDPKAYSKPALVDDDPLAFGIQNVEETFVYIVFPLLNALLGYIAKQVKANLNETSIENAMQWLRSLFQPDARVVPLLSQAQLIQIEVEIDALIEQEVRRLGVKKNSATIIKNAVMARLALAKKN